MSSSNQADLVVFASLSSFRTKAETEGLYLQGTLRFKARAMVVLRHLFEVDPGFILLYNKKTRTLYIEMAVVRDLDRQTLMTYFNTLGVEVMSFEGGLTLPDGDLLSTRYPSGGSSSKKDGWNTFWYE